MLIIEAGNIKKYYSDRLIIAFDDSESIQNQKNMLTKYAIEKEWNIYKIYSDDDYSGLDKDRPEWNQMLREAETKKFNIILCKSQSRFTRDMELVEKYIHNKFGLWNKTTVKRILKNEMYIGNMIQGKRKKVSYKSKKIISTSKDQWIKVENTHEPIIEKRMFNEVQRRISERQRSTGEGKAHIFSTRVRCADCGSTMNKVTAFKGSEKLYSYLRCKIYAASGKKGFCTSHAIRLDLLQGIITEKLKEYINNYLDETNVAHRLQAESDISSRIKSLQIDINNIEKQLQQSTQVLKSLYLDKMKGNITNEQFIELKMGFSIDNDRLIKRKEDIEKLIDELGENSRNFDKWVEIVKQYKEFKELTHTMITEFIKYIEIGEKSKETGEQKVKIIVKTGYGKSLDEKFRLSLAIGLFVDKSVTLEKASELAGKPLANFIDILISRNIPWMEYTEQHVEEDDFAIMKYSEEKGNNE